MRSYRLEVVPKTDTVRIFRLYRPDGTLAGERELEGVDPFIHDVEAGYQMGNPDLPRLGRRLYEWLDGPTERWLETALPGAGGLAVHVDVAEGLRHLPWELLVRQGLFLCADAARPFTPVRRVSEVACQVETANRPLRVLYMACAPEGGGAPLDYEGEERVILDATRRQPLELVVEESGSLAGLAEQVASHEGGTFDVFHLTGHASASGGEPRFLMEDELGFRHPASAEEIAQAFAGRWPRLVFLSGCETGRASDLGALPSMAEALVRAGAPAVLGWALPVGDLSASRAAASLYEHLAVGRRVDEAVARARQRLLAEESPYWHLLRLYADATPLEPLVTPLRTAGREPPHVRRARDEFLDAGGKVEVCSREDFVGRRRPLQRCLRVLRSFPSEEAYHEGVLLHGMGGLGKSSLAARLCERMRDHRRVVLVGNVDEDGFVRTLSDKLAALDAAGALQRPGLSLAQRLRLLLEGPLATTHCLFVFDDFEHALEETGGGHVLRAGTPEKPGPQAVLPALLAAIRETGSQSRVIVTSRYTFPLSGPARLWEEGLESMRGAELRKKTAQLDALVAAEESDQKLAAQVVRVSAGNLRLLKRLNEVLTKLGSDAPALLDRLEETADEFREELLLKRLLAGSDAALRRLVALTAMFDIPLSRTALEAAIGVEPVARFLDRAVGLSFVEAGTSLLGYSQFYVSELLRPLVRDEASASEKRGVCERAAQHLVERWQGSHDEEAVGLEIYRLAMIAGRNDLVISVADDLATRWIKQARYRDAEAISRAALESGEDFRVVHNLARTTAVLGDIRDAIAGFERAWALAEILSAEDDTNTIAGRAAIANNLADALSTAGEFTRALEFCRLSYELHEKADRRSGMLVSLHSMASVMVHLGQTELAQSLFEKILDICEQTDRPGVRAATLYHLSSIYADKGVTDLAVAQLTEAIRLFEQQGDVSGRTMSLYSLANIHLHQGRTKEAMALYQEVHHAVRKAGDIRGEANAVMSMAEVYVRQGDTAKALHLMRRAITRIEDGGDSTSMAIAFLRLGSVFLTDRDGEQALPVLLDARRRFMEAGDRQGLAEALFWLGRCHAVLGDEKEATGYYEEALALAEQSSNHHGKAVILTQVALLRSTDGSDPTARAHLQESANFLASAGRWVSLCLMLHHMAKRDAERRREYLAQAFWLSMHAEVGPPSIVPLTHALHAELEPSSPAALFTAAVSCWLVAQRAGGRDAFEHRWISAFTPLALLAEARGITPEQFMHWADSNHLLDPDHILPRALLELEALVPEDQWLFDRQRVRDSLSGATRPTA